MNLDLQGKTALITGSSKGIGKAIAESLHKEGCNVILNGRNIDGLKKTAEIFQERINYFVADVTDFHECQSLIKSVINQCGNLDILVCNVGSGKSVPAGEENPEEWKYMLKKNFFSTTNMVQVATDALTKSHGSIVCISSIAGVEITGAPVTYSVAKSALNAYVRGISRDLAKKRIRINAVAPGNILFKGSVWDKKIAENPKRVQDMLEKEIAMKRFGTAKEVADFVTFLASPRSSFITGGVFTLDGGQIKHW